MRLEIEIINDIVDVAYKGDINELNSALMEIIDLDIDFSGALKNEYQFCPSDIRGEVLLGDMDSRSINSIFKELKRNHKINLLLCEPAAYLGQTNKKAVY
jgi:hypothetical protein